MILLLIVIYIAFIGLGVPDSLIGSAWPAIHTELNLPVEAVSIITLLISGSTVLSSMFSASILNKLGISKVTAISTAATAVALFGFSVTSVFWAMLPLAVLLGLGAGAIDAGLNNYVALHCKASHMNFLHCFYGVGVSLSPHLMSLALGADEGVLCIGNAAYRHIVIPENVYLPAETTAVLDRFVKGGGTISHTKRVRL